MGATLREVLTSRSACCVGTRIKDGDARSLVPKPGLRIPVAPVRPTDDGSLMEGRIMPAARLCGDCHPETDYT
jgi:hypothetical protein